VGHRDGAGFCLSTEKSIATAGIGFSSCPKRRSRLTLGPSQTLIIVQVNVEFTLEHATKAQRGSKDITTLSLTSALYGDEWSTPRPGHFNPGKNPVPFV